MAKAAFSDGGGGGWLLGSWFVMLLFGGFTVTFQPQGPRAIFRERK